MSARLRHLPLPVTLVNGDGTHLLCFGAHDGGQALRQPWRGSPEQAADIVRALNAYPRLVKALEAVRKDCRDPDTDAAVSPATGALVDEALAAAEFRR